MIFVKTCVSTIKIAYKLCSFGFNVISINGQMKQTERDTAFNDFKSGRRNILVATDLASRGLDFARVDLIVNYDIPLNSKTYVHRVGRTARAGRSGRAITLVSQYDIIIFQKIESTVGKKLKEYVIDKKYLSDLIKNFSDKKN